MACQRCGVIHRDFAEAEDAIRYGENPTSSHVCMMLAEIDRLRQPAPDARGAEATLGQLEAAFREGWYEGEREGSDAAHPLSNKFGRRTATKDWEDSDTRRDASLRAAPAGEEQEPENAIVATVWQALGGLPGRPTLPELTLVALVEAIRGALPVPRAGGAEEVGKHG